VTSILSNILLPPSLLPHIVTDRGDLDAGVPIVGIDAYDLPNFEIDISPWLGILCDGNSHTFELKVVGYDSTTTLGTVNSNWWITGSIFLWLDKLGNQTTGTVSIPARYLRKHHLTCLRPSSPTLHLPPSNSYPELPHLPKPIPLSIST